MKARKAIISGRCTDRSGVLWTSAVNYGLCSYDGKSFTCYTEQDAASLKNAQSLLEDADGQLWIGTSSGVYRLVGGKFINWTKEDALAGGLIPAERAPVNLTPDQQTRLRCAGRRAH